MNAGKTIELLTPRQADIFDFIRVFIQLNHFPPTIREIGEACGLQSSSTTQHHVDALVRKAYISKRPGQDRTIVVLEDWPE